MEPVKIELTDAEWMSLIDGDRPGGLTACCANISALRDVIISAARTGGEVHAFEVANFRRTLGWVLDGHEVDEIPALVRLREQVGAEDPPPHEPRRELFT